MSQHTYGIHAITALLKNQPDRMRHLYIQKDKQDPKISSIVDIATHCGIKISLVSRHELDRLSHQGIHQGVVAQCRLGKTHSEEDLKILLENLQEKAFLLILDGVQDPHNLGACLRSADAAGVHAVIAPKDKSVGITPTVAKVACGAAESVPFIQVTNLARTLRFLKEQNIWIMGAADDATKTIYQADFTSSVAIVLGAEGEGMRRLTKEHCDEIFKIPMHGSVSSLNVSVATGIFLFETVRQRSHGQQ